MGRALHARRPGMQVGLELAAVQMAPHPFLGMVVHRQVPLTLRTGPARGVVVARPDIHSLLRDAQLHLRHRPWTRDSQQVAVQLDVAHGVRSPFDRDRTSAYPPLLPTPNPEEPPGRAPPWPLLPWDRAAPEARRLS